MAHAPVDVIDLFAGPGGLGEGFASVRDGKNAAFRLALSIEKDAVAHRTLRLRSFFRQFESVPFDYYARMRCEITTDQLYERYPTQAANAARESSNLELKPATAEKAFALIGAALGNAKDRWVLIGGPPCQAYSLAGRSRLRGADRDAYEADGRHFLYREYLRILRRFSPPVFVMENVKGILSSTVGDRHTFSHILKDMKSAGYRLYSFTRTDVDGDDPDPGSFLIRAEDYSVPQRRHRVIVLGVRRDLDRGREVLQPQPVPPTTADAIGDLPRIRSGLPRKYDSDLAWIRAVRSAKLGRIDKKVAGRVRAAKERLALLGLGGEFIAQAEFPSPVSDWLRSNANWYLDERIGGVTLHSARHHMCSDLDRYLYASAFAEAYGASPRLRDFPLGLLPDHQNTIEALTTSNFSDRFRVQLASQPSTTVVSHIRKDGHYYIHYDPSQCRSLTVREAARLQTFPDSYLFEGTRTEQYQQVGNAVPPLLAKQLATVVLNIISQLRS